MTKFVIKIGESSWLTSKGYGQYPQWTVLQESAKRFESEALAKRYAKRVLNRFTDTEKWKYEIQSIII